MTDEEYQTLKEQSQAAWTVYQSAKDQADALCNSWLPIYQRLEKATQRRELLAEIAAEKGQS